jgi:Arc/MetJ family transcription regulator
VIGPSHWSCSKWTTRAISRSSSECVASRVAKQDGAYLTGSDGLDVLADQGTLIGRFQCDRTPSVSLWIRRLEVRALPRQHIISIPELDRPYTYCTRNVYSTCMAKVRTNIEIENTYLQAVMDRYHLHTKTEAVDLALRHLAGQPMSREEALAMRGSNSIGRVLPDSRPRGA